MQVDNGNINSRVSLCRDYPPGCGISSSITKGFSDSTSFHRYTRDFPPGCSSNSPKTRRNFPENPVKSNDSATWRRNVTAVKSELLLSDAGVKRNPQNLEAKPQVYNGSERKLGEREKMVEMKKTHKVKGKEPVLNNSGEREKVLEILRLFRERYTKISRSGKGIRRIDTTAYNELKNEGILVNRSSLMFGGVPGVEIGDKFHYRIELLIVGLHKLTQGGIDSMEWRGSRIATSIVANERHSDKMNDPHSLVYVGEGGVLKRHEVGVPPDQELKSGNRALWCSMQEKKPVRVIRGLTSEKSTRVLYVYDGLYDVTGMEKKKGPQGNMIFEFQMRRRSGQPEVPWQACRRYQF